MSESVGNGERGSKAVGDRGGLKGLPSVFDDVLLEQSNDRRTKGRSGGRGGGFGDFPEGGTFDGVILEENNADRSNRRVRAGGPATRGMPSRYKGVAPDVLAAFSAFDPISPRDAEKRRKQREAENASWAAAAAEFSAKPFPPPSTLDVVGDVSHGRSLDAGPGPGGVAAQRQSRACKSVSPVPPPNAVYSKSDIGPNALAEMAIPFIANAMSANIQGNTPDLHLQLREEDHGPTVPVSVMLRNLYLPPPEPFFDPISDRNESDFLSKLIPRVQLDIVVTASQPPTTDAHKESDTLHKAQNNSVVVASLPQSSSPCPNPRWDRIDEVVADSHTFRCLQPGAATGESRAHAESADQASLPPASNIQRKWEVLYGRHNVRGRIVASYPETSPRAEKESDGRNLRNLNNNSCSSSSSKAKDDEEKKEGDDPLQVSSHCKVVVAEVPIDPSLLRKLPLTTNGTPSSVPGGLSVSVGKSASTLPSSLPPNAVLVRYSDGSTRVLPDLYRLLRRAGAIGIAESGKATKRRSTGGSGPKHTRSSSAPMVATMSCHESLPASMESDRTAFQDIDDEEDTDGIGSLGAERDRLFSDALFDVLGDDQPKSGKNSSVEIDAALSRRDKGVKDPSKSPTVTRAESDEYPMNHVTVQPLSDYVEEEASDRPRDSMNNEEVETCVSSQLDIGSELQSSCERPRVTQIDVECLTEQLRVEKEALRMEEEGIVNEILKVRNTMVMVRELEDEIDEVGLVAQQESLEAGKLEMLIAVRRAKLIRDLESIYPIRQVSRESYSIAGLELPLDFYGTTVTDEDISAAMGFVCHLVFMCSKYLGVPLRYRLICNSSRSAVQEDGSSGKVYPLFREGRMVDRFHLERAVALLDRNVDHILWMQGISFIQDGSTTHILAKLRQLFVQSDSIIGSAFDLRST